MKNVELFQSKSEWHDSLVVKRTRARDKRRQKNFKNVQNCL